MKIFSLKFFFIALFFSFIFLFYYVDGHEYLNFAYVKRNLMAFQHYYAHSPAKTIGIFVSIYLFLTALAIPGSIVLTVLSGAIFGTLPGVFLVSLVGTIGATLSFLSARYILQVYVARKFEKQFKSVNRSLEQDGILYLFILRFIPVSPFVVINLVMGVTKLNVWTFIWTTFLGMLPGNWIYVYAGKKIGEIESASEIMTPTFILLLTILGVLPWLVKKGSRLHKKRIAHI